MQNRSHTLSDVRRFVSKDEAILSYCRKIRSCEFRIWSDTASFLSYGSNILSSSACVLSNPAQILADRATFLSDRANILSGLEQFLDRFDEYVRSSKFKTTRQSRLTLSDTELMATLLAYLNYALELKFSGKVDTGSLIAPSVWARDG